MSLRDRDESTQSCLGSQQVVVAVIAARGVWVITDSEELACLVEEKSVLDLRESAALCGQVLDDPNHPLGVAGSPIAFRVTRQLAQRRDVVEARGTPCIEFVQGAMT